jgi:hypothetical protein
MSEYLRDVSPRPRRPARDPLGKAALFSDEVRRPGTLVIECSGCGTSARMTYVDFALAHLPFSIWLPPLGQLPYNRRITCPACAQWTWVRARWLQ